jgi:ABC-type transport system involved in cytochrome c biogenesis permease component
MIYLKADVICKIMAFDFQSIILSSIFYALLKIEGIVRSSLVFTLAVCEFLFQDRPVSESVSD